MKKLFLSLVFLMTILYSAVALAEGVVNNVRVGVHTKEHIRIVVDTSEPVYYDLATKGKLVELKVEAVKAEKVVTTKQAIASNQVGNSFVVGSENSQTVVRLNLHEAIDKKSMSDFVLRSKGTNGTYRIIVDLYNRNTGVVQATGGAVQPAPKATTQASVQVPVQSGVEKKVPAVSSRPVVSSAPIKRGEDSEAAPQVQKPAPVVKKETPKTEIKKETPKAATVKTTTKTTTNTKTTKPVAKKEAPKPVLSKDGRYTILKTDNGEPYFKSTKAFKTSGGIKGKLIALDPGHGGSDPGAIGRGGTREKDITLQITNKIKENLEKAGAKVIMTRTSDKDVTVIPYNDSTDADELQARINVAEKNNADLLISIHNNSLSDRKVGGICTYYFNKTASDAKLAGKIQDKLGKGFQLRNMGTRQANFYMVKRCSMPAALIELCFISNDKEEKLLKNSWFQKKTAKLISEAVTEYFK